MILGKNSIAGAWRAEGNVVFKTFNPKLDQENPISFVEATPGEIQRAVTAAWEAFKIFRNMPGEKRAAFLRAIADEIVALDQALLEAETEDSGLHEGRAIGEGGRTVGQLRSFADLVSKEEWRGNTCDAAVPARQPRPKDRLRKIEVALGQVVVLGARNF